MFYSYVWIIILCFFLYSCLAIYESYLIQKERIERSNTVKLEEISNELEERVMTAQSMVSVINASTTIKKLYLSVLSQEGSLDSYTLYSILSDLKMIYASANRWDIDEMVIFVDGYTKAYSYTGVVALESEFEMVKGLPSISINKIEDAFAINGNGKLMFQRKGLLCIDDYTYYSGSPKGSIAILFQMDVLEKDIKNIIDDTNGVKVWFDDEEVIQIGEMRGKIFTNTVSYKGKDLTVELYSKEMPLFSSGTQGALFVVLLIGIILSVLFVRVAYYFAKRYYEPFGNLHQLVGDPEQQNADEMNEILSGIQELIGERNGYREKMMTIAPYVEQGMLHDMVTGNAKRENVQILFKEQYLDLKKPFFIVSVINFYYKQAMQDKEEHARRVQDICDQLAYIFSTEESKICCYKKDAYNVFLILNSDIEILPDDLFYQIHKYIIRSINDENCIVTLGIDEIKDDLSLLREACERAVKALEGMIVSGRGEVYFYEEDEKEYAPYYFPQNSLMKISKLVKECKLVEIKDYLRDIYNRNINERDLKPTDIHALVDEIHIITVKCIKENTALMTTHINVEKMPNMATLEETFDYYYVVYEALIEQLKEEQKQSKSDYSLEDAIINSINGNFCDPNISLQYLTDEFGVSSKYISLVCKNRLKTTYLQYIQDKRIRYAVELLDTTEFSVEQIGEMCGYTSSLTFRRNFKSIVGTTPSEYRIR